MRLTLSYPSVRTKIAIGLDNLSKKFAKYDAIVGIATGGIAHGALLAHLQALPFAYIRSNVKEHGRKNRIEGNIEAGSRVLVVEDLISTGKSSLSAIKALTDTGIEVAGVVSLFTYQLAIADENFEAEGLEYSSLANYSELLELCKRDEVFTEQDLDKLRKWRANPSAWEAGMNLATKV